ncbi:MAG TPA: IS66 family insertion sequence element accessory protein TnpB [Flavitalea sp.]|nr:IS66 family insertion sequence element accessory protein TnpB [Flavitalea sp.]
MSALLVLTDTYKFYFCSTKVDMRKSFDGLCGAVEKYMDRRVEKNQKEVYIFLNKNRTHLKLLLHENNGFTMLYRRQKNRFTLPEITAEKGSIKLMATEVLSLLGGLMLHRSQKNIMGYSQVIQDK